MSNIYIQEPPTCGKVILITTVGEIEIELWSKEAPKACRNFIQLSLEGYYNGTIFHRIVKKFIAQGGDPTGTGMGGESIYGEPFKDEIHTRLRFNRRGLLGLANSGNNDNTSQFFFTFGPTPELQKNHTIFGKVVGDTIFNMLKLEDFEVDQDDRPLYPPSIIRVEVLNNPFPDIVPRTVVHQANKKQIAKEKSAPSAVKNFKLLSFGEEAEEDEEELNVAIKKFDKSNMSSHDILDDPKLSKLSVENQDEIKESVGYASIKENETSKVETKNVFLKKHVDSVNEPKPGEPGISEAKRKYKEEIEKYSDLKKKIPKSGTVRESQTLNLLDVFKRKMSKISNDSSLSHDEDDNQGEEKIWKTHTFKCDPGKSIVPRDKSNKIHDEDHSDIYDFSDPRNSMNKRRREDCKKHSKNKRTPYLT